MGLVARGFRFGAAAALLAAGPFGGAVAAEPDTVAGLVAWYRADSLDLGPGGEVERWPDSSGNGHDLRRDGHGLPAVYNPDQVNGWPTVRPGERGSYSVDRPFDLASHTVFLVYKVAGTRKALFRSGDSEFHGVTLRQEGDHDRYQDGGSQDRHVKPYNEPTPLGKDYAITVLARDGDSLRSFINGRDVSAGTSFSGPVRVGKFFHLSHTRASRSFGDGLSIAEMIFYDRYLPDADREIVTSGLASKYAVEVAAAEAASEGEAIAYFGNAALLGTRTDADVNRSGAAVPWQSHDRLEFPFEHDPDRPTRLVCVQDGTRVRLYASLPLTAATAGVSIRVAFRVNGSRVLRGVGKSGGFGGHGGRAEASAQVETFTVLDAGDYVEVVTEKAGEDGRVTVDPGRAVFLAEVR